jgi:hypothetical protein
MGKIFADKQTMNHGTNFQWDKADAKPWDLGRTP